jgi:multidrug efflux pump subunit AcrA (membrane-fusion protein)
MTADITRIAPSADVRSRTFDVEATLPNPDDQIKVGMIASLKIAEPTGAAAASTLALPLTAVVRAPRDPRGFAVFVVDPAGKGDVARLREVKLGDVIGNSVLVTSGLRSGERVIERGATLVSDGETVRVLK